MDILLCVQGPFSSGRPSEVKYVNLGRIGTGIDNIIITVLKTEIPKNEEFISIFKSPLSHLLHFFYNKPIVGEEPLQPFRDTQTESNGKGKVVNQIEIKFVVFAKMRLHPLVYFSVFAVVYGPMEMGLTMVTARKHSTLFICRLFIVSQ